MYRQGNAWVPLQQPQLPHGWEKKWDPGNGRYFYIDHTTKTTHWELPAAQTWQQPARPAQNVTTSFTNSDALAKTITLEFDGVSEDYIKSMLRVYQNDAAVVRRHLVNKGFKKKAQPNSSYVGRLRDLYPEASEDIIKDVLVSTSNNFIGARTSLEAMGYKKKPQSTQTVDPSKVNIILAEYENVSKDFVTTMLRIHNNNVASVRNKLEERGYTKKKVKAKPNLVVDMMKKFPDAPLSTVRESLVESGNNFQKACSILESKGLGPKKTPKKTTITTSDDLSEQEKKKKLKKLQKQFPTIAESVVELALVGTMYDEDMAASILKESIQSVDARSSSSVFSSTTSSSRPESRERASRPKEQKPKEYDPKSFAPVAFGEDDYTPNISSVFSSSVIKPQSDYSAPSTQSAYKPRKIAPRVTKVRYEPKHVGGYKSENVCRPIGPDRSLVYGPDSSLLQQHMIRAAGPNRANRVGPLRSNRCGSNPSNAKGRAGINMGPMHGSLVHTYV